ARSSVAARARPALRARNRARRDELALRARPSGARLPVERRLPQHLAVADARDQPGAPWRGASVPAGPAGRGPGRAPATRAVLRAVAGRGRWGAAGGPAGLARDPRPPAGGGRGTHPQPRHAPGRPTRPPRG